MTQYMKLKKDYIPSLSDSVDLLVISGRFNFITIKYLKLRLRLLIIFFLAYQDINEN
jgi:hypothetical protein